MSGSRKEHRVHRQPEDGQSDIGLEQQSLVDVPSYPYPGTLRVQRQPQNSLGEHSDEAQSKQQAENREDEGGTV